MRKAVFTLSLMLIAGVWTPHSVAEDEPFAIRFGLITMQPTADVEILGEPFELTQSFGAEFDFEWYALHRLGLEGSIAFAVDADIESQGDALAGVSILPLTIGLNGHIIRTKTIDWSIGVVGGVVFYGDVDIDPDAMTGELTSKTDSTYGLQTSLDVGFAKGGRWGMNFGIKYLETDLELKTFSAPIPYNPVIVRVMGLYRW